MIIQAMRPEPPWGSVAGLPDMGRPPSWHELGLCNGDPDPDTWWPEPGHSPATAQAVCSYCPVREECAEWAISQGTRLDGVWGGLTKKQRRKIIGAARRWDTYYERHKEDPEWRARRRERQRQWRARAREAARKAASRASA